MNELGEKNELFGFKESTSVPYVITTRQGLQQVIEIEILLRHRILTYF